MENRPALICLTPVRNEAWCLDAFLICASRWADYIIIADQNSSDGSREIALKYKKVILIDNNDAELHETNRQRLMFNEARKIKGPRVLVALDADEIFTANYSTTNDWKKIVNAQKGDIFQFQWANIHENLTDYDVNSYWNQWAFFDDGTNPPKDGYIHVARVPWPENSTPNEIKINDFKVMHFQHIFKERNLSKQRLYQCIIRINQPKLSAISLYRTYKNSSVGKGEAIPDFFFKEYSDDGYNVMSLFDMSIKDFWQDRQVIEYFEIYGINYFRKLDIFEKAWIDKVYFKYNKKISDPRNLFNKLLHAYLFQTNKFRKKIFIRLVDKFLKKLGI